MAETSELLASIGEIRKADGSEEIRCEIKKYKDMIYMDLRTWFRAANNEMLPTKKGITIQPKNIGQVIDLLVMARDELNRRNTSSSQY